MHALRTQQAAPEQSRPNIVFILTDNVGHGVLSSYNGGILDTSTPRIDKLAAEGLRLTNANVEKDVDYIRAAKKGENPCKRNHNNLAGSRWHVLIGFSI